MRKCHQWGYTINLLYFWLQSAELAISRVKRRVENGGHNIPEDIIIRRYYRGLSNLFKLYLLLCDNWLIYNNSNQNIELVATYFENELTVDNSYLWSKIKGNYDE